MFNLLCVNILHLTRTILYYIFVEILKRKIMAILKTDTPIEVLRKEYGKVAVFVQKKGYIIMKARPNFTKTKYSKRALIHHNKFRTAMAEAVSMLEDPEVKRVYRAKCVGNQKCHNVLVAEIIRKRYESKQIVTGDA